VLVFVSYFCGIEGMVMSEWAEDKLHVAPSLFSKTYLITSIADQRIEREKVKAIRVPSLSWTDFKWELSEYQKFRGQKYSRFLIWLPIAAVFGRIWDFLFSKVSRNSAARWSWALVAFPVIVFLRLRHQKIVVFATGGATGGHLAALLAQSLTKAAIYLEFQDPIQGAEMVRTKSNSNYITLLERKFISGSTRTIFVSKAAATAAKMRYPDLSEKIHTVYPGARNFEIKLRKSKILPNQEIEFLHLGTLYGERNLDNFFAALDQLRDSNFFRAERVRVRNLGDIYLDNKNDYLSRKDFELLKSGNRVEGLVRASQSDILLLVQHADSRSRETIPFKTYDYLNLGSPVFAIALNPEIADLLTPGANYISDARSVRSIRENLEQFLNQFEDPSIEKSSEVRPMELESQFKKIFQ